MEGELQTKGELFFLEGAVLFMRKSSNSLLRYVLVLAVLVLTGAAALMSSGRVSSFKRSDKAAYLDQNAINFVRPGLVLKIASASIAQNGTISVRFTIADP